MPLFVSLNHIRKKLCTLILTDILTACVKVIIRHKGIMYCEFKVLMSPVTNVIGLLSHDVTAQLKETDTRTSLKKLGEGGTLRTVKILYKSSKHD